MAGTVTLAYDYPILGAFWTVFLLALAVLWFVLLFRVIVDVFRDDDLGGAAKTGWLLFVILLPFLGVFVYVVARGRHMGAREQAHARARQEEFESYVRTTAGANAPEVEQLTKLADMHDKGAISDREYERAKEKVLH
ncbi:SHOCT domain-containing protein [Actinacidiphila sp. bgisy144]|uniref:SHOCT domain-containing protein n=1 Tax=unclassified Actinacidiphila TaxID=2995708 RepID=UPI003EBB7364